MVSPIRLIFFSSTHHYTDSPHEILHGNYFHAKKEKNTLYLQSYQLFRQKKNRENVIQLFFILAKPTQQLFAACKSYITNKPNNKSDSKSFFFAFILFFFFFFFLLQPPHTYKYTLQNTAGNDGRRKISWSLSGTQACYF